jgi:uncharacterized membrane protein
MTLKHKQKLNKAIKNTVSPETLITHRRFELLDAARGFAILLMFIYHFSFDLNYYGFIQENFNQDTFWIYFRTIIVSLFLIIVGVSLYLASYKKLNIKRFQRRLILLITYSALVSLGSWVMYPKYMIFFGILHFITVASILGLFFVRLGILNLFLGLSLLILPYLVNQSMFDHSVFDHPMLQWFGLMTHLPSTVDYVPLIPWFGVVLIGIYLGQRIVQQKKETLLCLIQWQASHPISKLLILAGRYSLHIYMLHQPLFLGILYIIHQIIK